MAAMGIFHVDFDVVASSGADVERHPGLVDTGASYLSLPGSVLHRLGYGPLDRQRVIFATGQVAVWPVTEVRVRLAGRERTVIAFFADETSPTLVGAQTLESFGLGVDPLGRRLVPVDAYLAAGAGASSRRGARTSGRERSPAARGIPATAAGRAVAVTPGAVDA
jgi:predicted aspartyl protease